MGLDVRLATAADRAKWNGLVDRSPHGTPFHKLEFLDFLEEATGDRCYRFVGSKGQERMGVFPVFLRELGPVTVAFSPPPDLKITYLGPALVADERRKARSIENLNRRFVEHVLDAVESTHGPSYFHVKPSPGYVDARPFVWNGFDGSRSYTYVVDLSVGEDDLFDAFSADARRGVRECRDADCEVVEGDADTIRTFVPRLADLHDDEDAAFGIDVSFLVGLYEALPDDAAQVYEARVDGEFAGGWLLLRDADTAYYWQAYAERDVGVSVNDYAVWRMMRDAMDDGIEYFDLVGANVPRLCEYKSKFAPELATHEALERGTRTMKLVSDVYKRVR